MTQQTSKGITYPESTDHTRLWEHLETLADNVNAIVPSSVDVQVFTASGTWNRPAGALWVTVEVQGGGGGSGGCPSTGASQGTASPGGAGGEFARGTFSAATTGSSQAVTVGTGGNGGAAGANAGSNGGTSSFGSLITAVGGSGGQAGGAASSAASVSLAGADGGTGGTGGDFRVPGGDGCCSHVMGGFPVKLNNGGGSVLGAAQRTSGISVSGTNGIAGNTYGGGAAGASAGPSQSTQAGGAGADGVVIVTTYKA